MAGDRADWEFQRLHGMGEALYAEIVGPDKLNRPCRVYAPVGSHEDLLAYLVRRLLENGANTSFVNRIVDEQEPIDEIVADPIARLARLEPKAASAHPAAARPVSAGAAQFARPRPRRPAHPRRVAGRTRRGRGAARATPPAPDRSSAASSTAAAASRCSTRATAVAASASSPRRSPMHVEQALARASARRADPGTRPPPMPAPRHWNARPTCTNSTARSLMALIVREGGRTIPTALSEVREACDFLRYYAARARADFALPERLPGPTGERNRLALHGRGVFACISPWNFPLAIFTGQIAAALAAGNAVIAKPAEQTPLVAAAALRLLLAAGIPGDVLHLLPGPGERVGAALVGGSAHRRRRLHRLDRDGAGDQPGAGQARRADRAADRRDRRPERDDRRFVGACPSRSSSTC